MEKKYEIEEREEELNLFEYSPSAEFSHRKFPLIKATVVLIMLALFIVLYFVWIYHYWSKISLSKVSDDDSLITIIAKFRLSQSKVKDTVQILKYLRKKIHHDKKILMSAVEFKLIKYLFECLHELSHNDERVQAVVDVLNEIWASPEARAYFIFQANNGEDICTTGVPFYVDEYLKIVYQLRDTFINPPKESQPVAKEPNGFLHSLFTSKEETTQYPLYEYKLIMSLGLMAIDFPKVQSRVGDKGGLKFIVDVMESHRNDPKIAKWGCWSLVHLCFNHPPNKREIVQRGCVPLSVRILSLHFSLSDDLMVTHQALSLIYSLLSDDVRTKVNLSEVRQMALTAGVIEEIGEIEKRVNKEKMKEKERKGRERVEERQKRMEGYQVISTLCKGILNSLISEWS